MSPQEEALVDAILASGITLPAPDAQLLELMRIAADEDSGLSEPDMLGRAYEYLIEKFADDAGKKGGEFYTPNMVVRLIVELLDPRDRGIDGFHRAQLARSDRGGRFQRARLVGQFRIGHSASPPRRLCIGGCGRRGNSLRLAAIP